MSAILNDREEWLKLRKNYLGASDAPVVCGVSPWTTRFQLWQEKLGLLPEKEDNWNMRRGRLQEEGARQLYEKKTGNLMNPEIVFHPTKKFMMATLDGLSVNGDLAVEIKCPGVQDHETAKKGKVPTKYYPQLQHQLACINVNHIHYFSYRDGEGILVEIERDEKFLTELYQNEEEFWNKVLCLEAPELTPKDFRDKEECPEWKAIAMRWSTLSDKLKSLENEEKACRKLLIGMAEDSSAIGSGVRLTKIIRKGNVDYKSIPELIGVDLERYRKKAIGSWRLQKSVSELKEKNDENGS